MKAFLIGLKAKLVPELAWVKAHGVLLAVCVAAVIICALVAASLK